MDTKDEPTSPSGGIGAASSGIAEVPLVGVAVETLKTSLEELQSEDEGPNVNNIGR